MKKNIYNLLIIFILCSVLLLMLVFSKEVITSVLKAIIVWKESIFTSLFPFFIIADLLINYGFIDIIGEIFKKIMHKLFYLPGEASFVIISSILTGCPSSAKYIKELLDKDIINYNEAQYMLSFTHFSNPLFVIGIVGNNILNNKKAAIIIYSSMIIGNFLLGILIRKKRDTPEEKIDIKNALRKINKKTKNNNFIVILSNSILKTINTLLLLLGIMIVFFIITTLLFNLTNMSLFEKTIISGFLEITQGINLLHYLNVSIYIKTLLITFLLSFGGISIHTQTMSIINNKNIKYKYYLASRITHACISSLIALVLIKIVKL